MNNELMNIKLENNNIIKSTDLVEIINYFRHEEGKNDLRHDNFKAKIEKEIETLESLGLNGHLNFKESYYINSQNKKQPCFELDEEGMLIMLNKESTLVRYKTVQYIKQLKEENKKLKETISEKDRLLLGLFSDDKMVVAQSHKALVELEKKPLLDKIEKDKPKVTYYDTVLKSDNLVAITSIAQDYGMSGKAFNQKLKELKVQYKQGKQWILYSKYKDLGWVQSETYCKENKSYLHTKWTQNGRLGLYKLLKENDILPVVERKN